MIVLALETATRGGSLALAVDGRLVERPGDSSRTHGERLPGDVLALLEEERVALDAVDRLAVVAGPGSFTGLRVGLAAMQGLALAGRRLVVPIPPLDAIIAAWRPAGAAVTGLVAACLDGQRGEVFAAAARSAAPDAALVPVLGPIAGQPGDVAARLAREAGGDPITLVAVGVERHRATWDAMPMTTVVAPRRTLAGAAARMVAGGPDDGIRPHALRPLYVRRPDAEIARDRRQSAPGGSGWTVEPATPADRIPIEAIERQSFSRAWTSRSPHGAGDASHLYVLRPAPGQVAAYCACWIVDGELHINDLAVEPGHRRRGLATALLRAVARDAVRRGARSATLEVRESNQAARALYAGLGFAVGGVRRDYYDAPREDAVILWHHDLQRLA